MTEQKALKEIPERLQRVWKMRERGATFISIGKQIGVCCGRARDLYYRACRRIEDAKLERPWRNLTGSSYHAVRQFLGTGEDALTCQEQREFVVKGIREGVFHPDKKGFSLGWKSYAEICKVLGVDQLSSIRRRCPCCGHIIPK
jgi:hypothetical protein